MEILQRMKKHRGKIITAIAVIAVIGVSGLFTVKYSQSSSAESLIKFNDVLNVLSENYVDEIPPEDMVLEAIHGLVESLDPHSQLLDIRNRKRLMEQTKGEFGGIGIEISIRDDTLTVLSPIPGTPAYRIGLQAGDRIVKIEDEPTVGMSLEDAVKRLKGKPGTQVNIWIRRISVDSDIHFEITRAIIKIESIQGHFMLGPETGYVRLGVFSESSAQELLDAMSDLRAHGMKKIIFDLRDNPGGLLSRAVDISDIFLDPGQVIVSTRGRIRSSNRVYRASRPPVWSGEPVIVLISNGSASASEIVSGALQDHDKAVIMGETSFGKASVQTIIDLRDDYALKLTTAKYYTPSGRSIHSDRGAGFSHQRLLVAEDTMQTFRTDSGRIVKGGGGITPDLVLKNDTLSSAERKILTKAGTFRNLMFRYAVEYKNNNEGMLSDSLDSVAYVEDFMSKVVKITPKMFGRAREMMDEEDFDLTDKEYSDARELIQHWMSYYISDACYDRNTAQRMAALFDDQLSEAASMMRDVPAEPNFVEHLLAGRTLPDTVYLSEVTR